MGSGLRYLTCVQSKAADDRVAEILRNAVTLS